MPPERASPADPGVAGRASALQSVPGERAPERRDSRGLTTADAQARLAQYGPNATPEATARPWRRALSKFWAPVPWLLEAAVLFEVVLGDYLQAAVIAVLLSFNAALGFLQENRAQSTLDALKSRLALDASVRRDGAWTVIPASQLVPDDIVKLSLGTIVSADVRIITGDVLLDHSTLTGESLPVEAGPGFETWAGALVRKGEAVAQVTATGARTEFGRTAELVRIAHAASSQEHAVLRVVRNLVAFDAVVIAFQVVYAAFLKLPTPEIVPLALTAILAAIPVALPATFTLATTLGARTLARQRVLPTRLSAIDEAASMDVLCADKTGTLTKNELAVSAVRAMAGFDEAHVLGLAALASSEGARDPVDAAICLASSRARVADLPKLVKFVPFDPARKMSEASVVDGKGRTLRVVKGAWAQLGALASGPREAATAAAAFQEQGQRVLGVAVGPTGSLKIVGLIALSDPPSADSRRLIAELADMGVRTVMVTGDAPVTARVVADAVGITGGLCPPETKWDAVPVQDFGIFAGVLPTDKFRIVKAFQKAGHTVGMCGDGANDAPALRQAQLGIAVASATDVAKSAAGIVLTEPGLAGIVIAVTEGRIVFQRILTYVMRSLARKIDQMLFLTAGLIMTGHAILTPLLMVILMTTSDVLVMSSTTDNVRPSRKPNAWRIDNLTIAGVVLAFGNLAFCTGVLAIGQYRLGMDLDALRTLAVIVTGFSGQAVFYAVRERRHLWSSRPSLWVMASSAIDLLLIGTLAVRGILMAPVAVSVVLAVLAGAMAFAFVLDALRLAVFRRLKMA